MLAQVCERLQLVEVDGNQQGTNPAAQQAARTAIEKSQLPAVAESTMDKHQFRESGLKRLQAVETALLNKTVPESRLIAIDRMRDWLSHVTN